MRRLAVLGVLATLVATAAASASAATAVRSGGITVSQARSTFPTKSLILTLPAKAQLSAAQVSVTENGGAVAHLQVLPEGANGTGLFGVVLVVDASDSMRGAPIAAAMNAARTFAARRAAGEELAVVTFNSAVNVALPFTQSTAKIGVALDKAPRLAYGTHIYDAVDRAVRLLAGSHLDSSAIVLLSDGADTGSSVNLAKTVAAAKAAHVRIFTVGLRSKAYDPVSLKGLAAGADGLYAEAAALSQLGGIYDSLGTRLAGQYVIRYDSLAGPVQPVFVRVHVRGVPGEAAFQYQTPPLPVFQAPPAGFHNSLYDRVVGSQITAIVVVVLCAALVGFAIMAAVRPTSVQLRKRMSEYVALAIPRDSAAPLASQRQSMFENTESSLSSLAWWNRFKEELEIAQVTIPALEIVVGTILITALAVILLAVVLGSPVFGIIGLTTPLAVRIYLQNRLERRRKLFSEQLPDSLQVVASALRGGHSLAGALAVVVDAAVDPMRSEMQRAVADEQLGKPLEEAITLVAHRMDNRDLEQLSLVAKLQRDTGVSAAEVIDKVTETVRERFELRRLVNTLTSQARMSRWVVTALPVALAVIITLLNPHYMHPLFTKLSGKVLLVISALLVIGGSLVIKKIVNIKV
jgi:tight adherence protein B